MKLCKDCKNIEWTEGLAGPIGLCTAPQRSKVTDPVSGKEDFKYSTAKVLRQDLPSRLGGCGMEAQWFEQRESLADENTRRCQEIAANV